MFRNARYVIQFFALSIALLWTTQASAAPLKFYDFNGDFSDTLGVGNDLTPNGGNLATFGRYSFAENQGLRLTDAFADPFDYAIEIGFQVVDIFDTGSGFFGKLLDFEDTANDSGLYIVRNLGTDPATAPLLLSAYSVVQDDEVDFGPGEFQRLVDVSATLSRDGSSGMVSVFLNGNLQFSFDDSVNQEFVAVGNILNIAQDDTETTDEFFSGSIDFIRISDSSIPVSPVPLPANVSLSLVAFGSLTALSLWRRRRGAFSGG